MEAALLSSLEKRDLEYYNLLKARQEVRLTRAGIRLQDVRVREAESGVDLAELQQERAQIQADAYQEWLEAGLNEWEQRMIDAYHKAANARTMAAFFDAGAQMAQASTTAATASVGAAAAASNATVVALMAMGRYMASAIAIQAETIAQTAAIYASYERRKQEWELQKSIAEQDIRIGAQQIKLAQDRVRVVGQERTIAIMQAEYAEDGAEFLANKFTNRDLYDWMSGILEGVYSFFLQQATATAQLAANQLAFERQEVPPPFIQADYWEAPSEDAIGGSMTGETPERRGLTGSARLLQDIHQLDQYAFETDQRKLQLTKTISLARLYPREFQQFRETGVLPFATSMELFDRDFPGHYLRLIKRVRTSVIALIPPTEGIKATLLNGGISRVVIGGYVFQTKRIPSTPQSVALTSPSNATGLFELETQSEMLFPFEGLGVDTSWEFRMPKAANRFDYNTIADVLITIEYTALNSYDYRQQVIRELDTSISAVRPFSFKNQFADAWYDLHNPDRTETPMTVRFHTRREDFPPNIEINKIDNRKLLLYFARHSGETFELEGTLTFTPGGEKKSFQTVDGAISIDMSTDTVAGEWELTLLNTQQVKERFEKEEIEDILFVITYSGHTPEWPM
jgi:hypothetical protein